MNEETYKKKRAELLAALAKQGVEKPAHIFPLVREHIGEYENVVARKEQIDRMRALLIDAENQNEWNKQKR